MNGTRRKRSEGGDLVGSTIQSRGGMQEKSMRSERGTAQAANVSNDTRRVVNSAHAERAGFEVREEVPGGRATGLSKARHEAKQRWERSKR